MTNRDYFILIVTSIFLKILSVFGRLPSGAIDTFIRIFAMRSLKEIGYARTLRLFINPISSIRYWEFDFALRHLSSLHDENILDVSSPRFFGLYLAKKHPDIHYMMINPDKNDTQETLVMKDAIGRMENFSATIENALALPYRNNTFDRVISISVIEHISDDGDTKAVREMMRVLKPGGMLILTTHVMKKGRMEYRNTDEYSLGLKKQKGRYFFQRVYDTASLRKRILLPLHVQPVCTEIIGEKEAGWFDSYIERWIQKKIKETVYDPWYMMTKFKAYESIESLDGIGVIGLVFRKPKM